MSTTALRPYCVACIDAQANHTMLWIDGASDAISLRLSVTKLPFYSVMMQIAETLTSILGHASYRIFTFAGVITLSGNIEDSVSNRSKLLWQEAKKRGLDMQQLQFFGSASDTFMIKRNGKIHFFMSLPLSPSPASLRMDDKILFKERMEKGSISVPKSRGITSLSQAEKALDEMKVVCAKPRTGSNGRHTYPNISTKEQLAQAFKSVKQINPFVSIEEHLEGNLCRATCVEGKLIGFLESAYPSVIGDGTSTVRELVDHANTSKLEGVDDMVLNDSVVEYIRRRGYTPDSILPVQEKLQLTYRGGTSSGGSNREHGRNIHPSFIEPIEKAAVLTGLAIVGFDIIIPDPQQPEKEQKWGFIEANSLPWIDLHATPYYGPSIDLSAAVWDAWEKRN